MPTQTARFNWACLDRNTIIDFLQEIASEVVDVNLTVLQFHSTLVDHLKKIAPLRFRKLQNSEVALNRVWVGGIYYSDWDQDKKKCIEVSLSYSSFSHMICITKKRFMGVIRAIADTIFHELIHMRQYRRRKFKIIPDYPSTADKSERREEQSYLGCSDEIDAYGFNIACELIDKFNGDYDCIINYLNENQKDKQRRHNSWRMYLKAFQHDHTHPVIQRLKRKVIHYLPHAYIGKPYCNKNWIDY